MYLRDLSIRCSEIELKDYLKSINHVVEIFLYYLPKKYNFCGLGKVNISLAGFKNNFYAECFGIAEYCYPDFELKKFQALSLREQEVEILNIITSSFLFIAKKFQIDPSPILETSRKTLESNFYLKIPLKISKCHGSRFIKANLMVIHKSGGEDIDLELTNKSQTVVLRENLLSGGHFWNIYYGYSKSKWQGNTFQIYGRDGKITYEKDFSKYIN